MSVRVRGNDVGPVARQAGLNVKVLRTARRMSQAELSKAVGELGWPVPVSSVGKFENGTRRIDLDELDAMARALGTSIAAILGVQS